jgi:hypothetical protein
MRDPEAWRSVPDLTEEECEALEEASKAGFWKQPKQLRVTVIALCIAAIIQYVLWSPKSIMIIICIEITRKSQNCSALHY